MLNAAALGGNAYHAMVTIEIDSGPSGYLVWQSLLSWYWLPGQRIDQYTRTLENATLDADYSATTYINTFCVCLFRLKKLGEVFSKYSKKRTFLNGILGEDFISLRNTSGINRKTIRSSR